MEVAKGDEKETRNDGRFWSPHFPPDPNEFIDQLCLSSIYSPAAQSPTIDRSGRWFIRLLHRRIITKLVSSNARKRSGSFVEKFTRRSLPIFFFKFWLQGLAIHLSWFRLSQQSWQLLCEARIFIHSSPYFVWHDILFVISDRWFTVIFVLSVCLPSSYLHVFFFFPFLSPSSRTNNFHTATTTSLVKKYFSLGLYTLIFKRNSF